MQKVDVKMLLDNAVHFGHRTQKWNPKMRKFIFGERGGIHVFDLEITLTKLAALLDYLKNVAADGKTILFVSTKPQTTQMVEELAVATGSLYACHRWINGTLTNYSTIKKRVLHLKDLKADAASGGLDRFTKQEAAKLRKEMVELEEDLGGIMNMTKMPDVLFVVDAHRDRNAVLEGKKKNIPVVGIADTNVDPDLFLHFVPGNDDAMKSVTLIMSLVKEAIMEGKKNRALGVPQKKEVPHA